MAIPMAHLQPNLSSSAPTDSQSDMHRWAAKRSRAGQDPPREQDHQTRAPHGDQADQNGDAEAGRGTRTASSQARRLSALHGSRSRSRGNLRSDSRHNIRWNDSSESLVWSSQEDLAQLLPDRASADGVERPPQEGFSGRKQWLLVRDWPGNRYAHCTCHGDTLSAQLVFVLA